MLTQIIRKVIDVPNDKSAWNELLHFGPVILAKPKRGGANRNLSNIIVKRTAAWGKDPLLVTQEHTRDQAKSQVKTTKWLPQSPAS